MQCQLSQRPTVSRSSTRTGERAAGRVQPRLAADGRRLGRPSSTSSPSTASARVAHDRRGGGRSSQPWDGNDLDHYADDLAALIEAWTCTTSCSSAIRPAAARSRGTSADMERPGWPRWSLLGAIPPLMLKTDANPEGLPIERVRRDPGGRPGGPFAVLQGPGLPVLRRQPGGRQVRRAPGTRSG